ncbi:MAG: hypothetical protein ABI912_11655 [Actinomycetota bacterium]
MSESRRKTSGGALADIGSRFSTRCGAAGCSQIAATAVIDLQLRRLAIDQRNRIKDERAELRRDLGV